MKTKFRITGMHCVSCAISIDFDLEDLKGVSKSATNYAKQETTVEYDPHDQSIDSLKKQILKTGYVAEIIKK